MKKIQKMIESYRNRNREADERFIRSEFKVTERNGSLWLTHCGVAFMKVSSLSSAEGVASELEKARDTAIEFLSYENRG